MVDVVTGILAFATGMCKPSGIQKMIHKWRIVFFSPIWVLPSKIFLPEKNFQIDVYANMPIYLLHVLYSSYIP